MEDHLECAGFNWLVGWFVCLFILQFYILAQSKVDYRLTTVHTHGDFIMLPNWETRLSASWLDISLSHTILTLGTTFLTLS